MQMQTECLGDLGGEGRSVVFSEDSGMVSMSPWASRNWSKQAYSGTLHKAFKHRSQGSGCPESVVLENVHEDLPQSLLRCYPLCWKTPEEWFTPPPLPGGRAVRHV